MSTRPAGSRTVKVFNPGIDKRIPNGFIEVVIGKGGDWVGFMVGSKFYRLGEKAPAGKTPKLENPGLSAAEIDDRIDPENARAYLDDPDPTVRHNAKVIMNLISTGQMAANGDARKQTVDTSKIGEIVASPEEKKAYEKKKKSEKRAKDWATYDALKAENDAAAAKGKRLPHQNLQPPKSPRPVRSNTDGVKNTTTTYDVNDTAAARYAAQVPKTATGGTKTVTSDGTRTTTTVDGKPISTGLPTGRTPRTGTATTPPKKTAAQLQKEKDARAAEVAGIAGGQDFWVPDSILANDAELKGFVQQYINGKITKAVLADRIRTSKYVAQYSASYREKFMQNEQYKLLRDKGNDVSHTPRAEAINKIIELLRADAKRLGAVITDQGKLESIAEDLWLKGLDGYQSAREGKLKQFITIAKDEKGNPILSGQAGKDYADLVKSLRANGFKVEQAQSVFGKSIDDVLRDIADGEDIETYKQKARNLAAYSLGEAAKQALYSGYDLDAVAAPYLTEMSRILELNPDSIDLNDSLVKFALSGKDQMNLYDFQKAMRKDDRWQYTSNARKDVYDSAYNVLKNFGFTG